MHMNYQLMTGKQFNVHPGLQDAWQEIVNIYPELDEVAEWDCLQVKLLKVIPQRKADLEQMEKLERLDMKYSYRKKDMLPTISVKSPKSLAYTVGWYLDFSYGSACAHLGMKDPTPFSSVHYCEAVLEMMMELGFQNASEYWDTVTPFEKTLFLNDKSAAFTRAFETTIAVQVYKDGRVPLSCSDNLALLDPNNPLHNREEMMVPMNPHYAFVLSWWRFEGFQGVVQELIHNLHETSRKYFKVPDNMV